MKIKEAEMLEMKAIVMEDEIYNGTHTDEEVEQLKEELKSFIENNINTDEYQKATKKKALIGLATTFVEGAILGCVVYSVATLINK